MAKSTWAAKIKAQKTAPETKTGEGRAAPAIPSTKRTTQPETTPAVDASEVRTSRISTRIFDRHNRLLTKLTYAKAMNTGRRPLPCEIIEEAIEALAKDYEIE